MKPEDVFTRDSPIDRIFDAARGLYWYASDWHDGQSSALYSILSAQLQYTPAASERGCTLDGDDMLVYIALEAGQLDPQALCDWIKAEYQKHADD